MILEPKRRAPRRHPQIVDFRERGQNFLGNAIAEIIVIAIRAEIGEWQDGNRVLAPGRLEGGVDVFQVRRSNDAVTSKIKKP